MVIDAGAARYEGCNRLCRRVSQRRGESLRFRAGRVGCQRLCDIVVRVMRRGT